MNLNSYKLWGRDPATVINSSIFLVAPSAFIASDIAEEQGGKDFYEID